jgi:hypothetical protein
MVPSNDANHPQITANSSASSQFTKVYGDANFSRR